MRIPCGRSVQFQPADIVVPVAKRHLDRFLSRGAPMHRLIRVRGKAHMEVLGSFEPSSLNPRRNTSKSFFEALRSGDPVETCLRFVSSLSPLFSCFIGEVDTKLRQGGDMNPLTNDLSSTRGERYNERQNIPIESHSISRRDCHAEGLQAACLIRTHRRSPAAKIWSEHSARCHRKVRQSQVRRPQSVFLSQRRVYFFRKEVTAKKRATVQGAVQPVQSGRDSRLPGDTKRQPPKPKFEFTYSERYNLTRLPPEEAAAIRKKLEAEGH
jgi:hypothetical protein